MEKVKVIPPRPSVNWRAAALSPGLSRCALSLAAGLLLSGTRILSVPLPAAVCVTAALGCSLPALFCFLGAAAGCLLLWDTETVLLTLSAGFLALTAAWTLRELPGARSRFFPALTALLSGLLAGVMFLLSGGITAGALVAFFLQMAVLPIGVFVVQKLLSQPSGPTVLAALFALTSGAGGMVLPGGVPLGAFLAAGAVFRLTGTGLALPAAAVMGLALDWSWQGGTSCVAMLTAAALLCGALPQRRLLRWAGFVLTGGAVLLLSGGGEGQLFLAAAVGSGVSLLLPGLQLDPPPVTPGEAAQRRLASASRAMEEIYRRLEDVPETDRNLELSDVFDKATGRICTTCAGYGTCWKRSGSETCRQLMTASSAVLECRNVVPADFSEEFQTKCRHLPQLCFAITDALEEDMGRRQKVHQRREQRAVFAAQYRVLSDFLRVNVLPSRPPRPPHFRADTACLVSSRRGKAVSGDRCAGFAVGERQYLLLCDGMGTGPEAAVSSRRAMKLLTDLLRAGMEPDGALETLGAMAILCEDGGFSTVDLAWVSLLSGEGVLYKWGGGPSYLKTPDKTIKLGTATLPPGVGVGGTHQAQQIRLSLGRGEVLILTSDGVDGEDAQRLIRSAVNFQAEDLAAGIIRCGCSEGEDDRSAAVLALRPASAQ